MGIEDWMMVAAHLSVRTGGYAAWRIARGFPAEPGLSESAADVAAQVEAYIAERVTEFHEAAGRAVMAAVSLLEEAA